MDNKEFLDLEFKCIEYLRSYVELDCFLNHFHDISKLQSFFMSLPLNDDCSRYIEEYSRRMSVFRSTMSPKEKAFEERAKVQVSDKFRALLYLCISIHEDVICEPLY